MILLFLKKLQHNKRKYRRLYLCNIFLNIELYQMISRFYGVGREGAMEYPASDECIIILQIFQFFVYSGVNSVILPLEGRAHTIYFASVCTSQCCILIYPKSDILYDISADMSDIFQIYTLGSLTLHLNLLVSLHRNSAQ